MANDTMPIPQIVATVRGDQRIAAGLGGLILLSFGIRLYVRIYLTKHLGVQDWAMVATVLFAVAHISVTIANGSITLAIIMGDVTKNDLHTGMSRTMGTTFVLTLVALKISVGSFFLYIFPYQRFHRVLIYTVMVLSTLLGLVYIPVGNFTCAPFKVYADQDNTCPQGIKQTSWVLLVSFSIVNIIGDLSFCLIGCAALWHAMLPRLTKLSASVLLCLGCVGGIASIVRLYYYLAPANIAHWSQEIDVLIRWMLIEVGSSVVAANLALAKPLIQVILVKFRVIDAAAPVMDPKPTAYLPSDKIFDAVRAQSNASSRHGLLVRDIEGVTTITLTDKDIAEFCRGNNSPC